MLDKLMKILNELRPDIEFENNSTLIDDSELDSFDIVTLIGEICEEFDVEIKADDIIPENFNSVSAMMCLINKLQED